MLISLKDEECCLQFAVAQLASKVPPQGCNGPHPMDGRGVQRPVLASSQGCTGRVCGGDGQAIHPCPAALNSVTKSSQQSTVPVQTGESSTPDFR